jgi:hypothetical protein
MLETSTPTFLQSYFDIAPADRVNLLLDYLGESGTDVHRVWDILDVYSADADGFSLAVENTIERDPRNLLAMRALAWLNVRRGQYAKAKDNLLSLIDQLPSAVVERRELLRVGFVAPELLTPQIADIGRLGLNSPIAKTSYEYQIARASGSATMSIEAEKLRSEMADAGTSIKAKADKASPLAEFLAAIEGAGRIALVGNGPSLRGAKRGPEIDRYDFVVRCNFPVIKDFADDVGSRTDAIFFTEALFRLFDMYLDRDPSYRSTRLVTLANPAAAAGLDPVAITRAAGKTIARFPETSLDIMKDMTYRHLTTGAQAYLLLAGLLGKQITVFGFDFYSQKELHYFTQSAGLWLAHEVQYEQFLFRGVVKPVFGAHIR